MTQFFIGIVIGIIFMGILTAIAPLSMRYTQDALIGQGHAIYHPTTGEFTLKECR